MKSTPQSQPSKGGLWFLPPVSVSSARWPLSPAAPSPVPDLLQQGRVLVVPELASSRPRHVHDVSVGGHQHDVEWVLQLATKGWGQRTDVSQARCPSWLSPRRVRQGMLASPPCRVTSRRPWPSQEWVSWSSGRAAQKWTSTDHRTQGSFSDVPSSGPACPVKGNLALGKGTFLRPRKLCECSYTQKCPKQGLWWCTQIASGGESVLERKHQKKWEREAEWMDPEGVRPTYLTFIGISKKKKKNW